MNRAAAFKPVEVRVRTYKDKKETGNYEVWFAPAAYGDGSRDDRFDKHSSPTNKPLIPGNYHFWARSTQDGVKGARHPISIGKGKTSQEIDITAP